MHLMIVALALLTALTGRATAASDFVPITIDLTRAWLDAPNDDLDPGAVRLASDGPGFLYGPFRIDHEFHSARRLAHELHARFGLTLVLLTLIGGVDVPGYDGLVLDRDGQIVANFVVATSGASGLNPRAFATRFRRAREFAEPGKWAELLLKKARILAGHHGRDDVAEVLFRRPDQLAALRAYARAYRLHRATFAVGHGRPTWALAYAIRWSTPWERHLEGLAPTNGPIERVYLLHRGRLTDLTATCARELT